MQLPPDESLRFGLSEAPANLDPRYATDAASARVNRLLAELPYVPLWYENQVYVCRSDIEGYRLATDGNYDGLQWVHRRRAGAGDAQGTLAAQ